MKGIQEDMNRRTMEEVQKELKKNNIVMDLKVSRARTEARLAKEELLLIKDEIENSRIRTIRE